MAHDQIMRFLSAEEFTSKDLWSLAKPTIREVEQEDGVLICDDTIQEKLYIDDNELMRKMVLVCVQNKLKFRFVLFDTWFSSKENMCYIKKDLRKDFNCSLKGNRLAAVSAEDYQANRFIAIEELPWQEETEFIGWLKDVPFPVNLVRQVFTNKDGSTGILYLACSDTTLKR